jgi:hypothetical protein
MATTLPITPCSFASWSAFRDYLRDEDGWVFRGHRDAGWPLAPSLERVVGADTCGAVVTTSVAGSPLVTCATDVDEGFPSVFTASVEVFTVLPEAPLLVVTTCGIGSPCRLTANPATRCVAPLTAPKRPTRLA